LLKRGQGGWGQKGQKEGKSLWGKIAIISTLKTWTLKGQISEGGGEGNSFEADFGRGRVPVPL